MARLVLVRHGQSIWNRDRRFQGQSGPGLTDLGHRQAKRTAEFLAAELPEPDVVIRSDLERVEETAAPVEHALGLTAQIDPRWREIDVGTWTGRTHADVAETDAEALAAWRRCHDVQRGDGERFSDLRRRVGAAMADLADRLGHGVGLVLTHGGPVRVTAALVLGLATEAALAPVGNCSITVVRPGPAPRLVRYGETAHLATDQPI